MSAEPRFPSSPDLIARMRTSIRREWRVLVGLLLVALAVWAFVELAGEVRDGSTKALDRAILLALRDAADPQRMAGPPWLQEVMRDFTGLGGNGVLTLITVGVAGFLVLDGKRQDAGLLLLAVISGLIISHALKFGFARSRPDLVPHGAPVFTSSFPSSHSMMSAVVYLTIAAMLARLRPGARHKIYMLSVAVLLTLVVGASRVYLGVHWPTDVLAGWVVGSGWALICWYATLLLQARGKMPPT